MSNYTQVTFFTPKDSLPITDPNKTIFGAAYDVEFANISAAIATKLDSTFSNPSLVSLNITSVAAVANGLGLSAANTLGLYANSTLVATFASTGITFNVPFSFTAAGILTVGGLNVNGTPIPTNGFYLPSANTIGIATNGASVATIGADGGWALGTATGGDKGAGTINAQGLFVNGVSVSGAGITVTTAATNISSLAVGQQAIILATGTATRASSTSLTVDTVLQFTNLAVSTGQIYWLEVFANFSSATAAVGFSAGYQGTITGTTFSNLAYGLNTAAGSTGAGQFGVGPSNVPGQPLMAKVFTTAGLGETFYAATLIGGINGTSTNGTIGLGWGQFSSSATVTTRGGGSWIKIIRLA
jgi:hypothetical protein